MGSIQSLLERIYERNPENGNYIIEISLDNYADIFNDWDHAPFRRKDIDPELLSFLNDSIDDIPMKNGVDVCFYLSDEIQDDKREQMIITWFRTFYQFYIELEKKKIRAIIRKSIVFFLISAVLLLSSKLGAGMADDNLLSYILTEIVIVGGWVFLWEAISLSTFERGAIHKLIKNYHRYAIADLSFRYR